jgi:hypothetical protein
MQPLSHQNVQLSVGRHAKPETGMCVMELASVLAGEHFCDAPRSVSPAIASLLRGYNDGLDDGRRQTLKRFAADSVGTATGRATERHRRRLVRASVPHDGEEGVVRAPAIRRIAAWNPYHRALRLGRHVAERGDDALHARVLGLVDQLINVTRSEAGLHTLGATAMPSSSTGAPGGATTSRRAAGG